MSDNKPELTGDVVRETPRPSISHTPETDQAENTDKTRGVEINQQDLVQPSLTTKSTAFTNVAAVADVIFLSLSRGFVGALSRAELTTLILPAIFFLGRFGVALISSTSAVISFICVAAMLLNVIWRNAKLMTTAKNDRDEALIGERLLNATGDDAETAEWLNTAVRFVWRRYPELIAGNKIMHI